MTRRVVQRILDGVGRPEGSAPLYAVGASYFNAFPAAWWHAEAGRNRVTLRVELAADAELVVYGSDQLGEARELHRVGMGSGETSVELGFGAGDGWLWFELPGSGAESLIGGDWSLELPERRGGVQVAMTTMDRPGYCLAVLDTIASDPFVLGLLDHVAVVDQGRVPLRTAAGFADTERRLGGKLRVIEQTNLGGSGGFSRGMLDALDSGADSVILLDDDVALEPDAIVRMVAFADACDGRRIVGAQMLDLNAPTVLHAWAERIDQGRFFWGPSVEAEVDLGDQPLGSTPWMHRRAASDFNGWWMCLIPTRVLAEIGLSLPYFIKWDDAEFGLRAADAGLATVALPGAALWHITWGDKDDAIDWQSYFHLRNRLVTALLHSSGEPRRLLRDCGLLDLRHLASYRYAAVAARIQAYRDVFAGPEHLAESLLGARDRVVELMRPYLESDPTPAPDRVERPRRMPSGSSVSRAFSLVQLAVRWMLPSPGGATARRAVALDPAEAQWWVVARHDSVLIGAAAGGARWFRRDRARGRAMLRDVARARRRLATEWATLAGEYRERSTWLAAPERWREQFEATSAPGEKR